MRWMMILFLIINLFILTIEAREQNIINGIYVLTHQWCRKCDNVIKIVQKLKVNFEKEYKSQVQENSKVNIESIHLDNDFIQQRLEAKSQNLSILDQKQIKFIQNYQKASILYEKIKIKYGLDKSEIPFPTLWIDCPFYTGFYQNQLTYPQLYYWINIYCKGQIPKCPQNKNINTKDYSDDYYFQISSQDFEAQHSQIISFQIQNPYAKFCISHFDLIQKVTFNQIKYQIKQGPLFFTLFNHNLRNYLFDSQNKLGVLLIFNDPTHPKVKQFIDIFKFISDSLKKDKDNHLNQGKISNIFQNKSSNRFTLQSQYHQSNLKNYDFHSNQLIYKKLVFVGACYNQNKRECMMNYEYTIETNTQKREKDPSQRPIIKKFKIPFSFVRSKTQNLKKLLSFSHTANIFQEKFQRKQKHRHSKFQLIAFNFDKQTHQIKANVFKETNLKLGNDFLFWLQKIYKQIFQKNTKTLKEQQTYKSTCLSSQIIHYLNERNLTAIKNNVRLRKFIQKINQFQQEPIKFRTIIVQQNLQSMLLHDKISSKKWKPQYFQICLKDHTLKLVDSYQEALQILSSQKNKNQINFQYVEKKVVLSDQL